MEDGVVLLHGILRTPLSMVGFARFFKKRGFRVLNLGYPSRKHDLAVLVNGIHDPIQRFRETFSGKIHFVGYSMGGLAFDSCLWASVSSCGTGPYCSDWHAEWGQ